MKVHCIYATVEGQTGKIASFIADRVRARGDEIALFNADETDTIAFDGVDAVILAASVHQRRHPRAFEAFLSAAGKELAGLDTMLISVSLSAAFPEGLEEAGEYVTEMKMRTGFEPDRELLVAGAVRNNHYDYFEMQVIRHVVLRDRPYDASVSDYEFTDWDVLAAAVDSFLS
ncbi:flavodoxin domain-containing protein [Roseobacter sp.]|uniref:flavodoxin domain-containing protein n=1 Tax=Roseobacter sp. TaxID=1907202 RepID=UPI0025EC25E2|nr:flavodoxin domain-containing protein [Roseobacter sp.]